MTQATDQADPLEGIRIIDCDSHLTEPADLWTSRAPASLKDRVPVQRTVDGQTSWYLDDELWSTVGGNTIRAGRQKVLGSFIVQPFEAIDRSAWSVKERLELLDEMGIYAQILYPNGIGFASNHIFAIENDRERLAILQIYNDFLAEVQQESGNRLLPQAMLPIWDMDLTVKEITRLIDKGITGFTLSDKPEMIGLPELPEPYFEPMWDLLNESGAVPNFHIGAGSSRAETEARKRALLASNPRDEAAPKQSTSAQPAWQYFGWQRRMAVGATQLYLSNVRVIANLCMSDLFDRFPKVKIVSAESGIGWVPFILESLEYQFDEMVTEERELAFAKRRPSEYFNEHLYIMFWFERFGAKHLKEGMNLNRVLVETDVPHPTCFYPGAREHFAEVLGHLAPAERQRVLQDNAAELYKIELPGTS